MFSFDFSAIPHDVQICWPSAGAVAPASNIMIGQAIPVCSYRGGPRGTRYSRVCGGNGVRLAFWVFIQHSYDHGSASGQSRESYRRYEIT